MNGKFNKLTLATEEEDLALTGSRLTSTLCSRGCIRYYGISDKYLGNGCRAVQFWEHGTMAIRRIAGIIRVAFGRADSPDALMEAFEKKGISLSAKNCLFLLGKEANVSRAHGMLVLVESDGKLTVRDASSKNGISYVSRGEWRKLESGASVKIPCEGESHGVWIEWGREKKGGPYEELWVQPTPSYEPGGSPLFIHTSQSERDITVRAYLPDSNNLLQVHREQSITFDQLKKWETAMRAEAKRHKVELPEGELLTKHLLKRVMCAHVNALAKGWCIPAAFFRRSAWERCSEEALAEEYIQFEIGEIERKEPEPAGDWRFSSF